MNGQSVDRIPFQFLVREYIVSHRSELKLAVLRPDSRTLGGFHIREKPIPQLKVKLVRGRDLPGLVDKEVLVEPVVEVFVGTSWWSMGDPRWQCKCTQSALRDECEADKPGFVANIEWHQELTFPFREECLSEAVVLVLVADASKKKAGGRGGVACGARIDLGKLAHESMQDSSAAARQPADRPTCSGDALRRGRSRPGG